MCEPKLSTELEQARVAADSSCTASVLHELPLIASSVVVLEVDWA